MPQRFCLAWVAPLLISSFPGSAAARHIFPPPCVSCVAAGGDVELAWNAVELSSEQGDHGVIERDGAVIAQLAPGESTFIDRGVPVGHHVYRLTIVLVGHGSAATECEVDVAARAALSPPANLSCAIQEKAPPCVDLHWTNGESYERIAVQRNGELVASLPGDAIRYTETAPGQALYIYELIGFLGVDRSPPVACAADLGLVPRESSLYLIDRLAGRGARDTGPLLQGRGPEEPDPPPLSSRLTAILENADPVQGWSFGLCFDTLQLRVRATDLEGTVSRILNQGSGPGFLSIQVHAGGLAMTALIDRDDPLDVLLPGTSRALLNIDFGAGPLAQPGETYEVRFCDVETCAPNVPVALLVNGQQVVPVATAGHVRLDPAFLRGDANDDLTVDLSDGVFTLGWLFQGEPPPSCLEAADANGSLEVDITDPIYTFHHLFSGGPPIPAPFPDCGLAASGVGCQASACGN